MFIKKFGLLFGNVAMNRLMDADGGAGNGSGTGTGAGSGDGSDGADSGEGSGDGDSDADDDDSGNEEKKFSQSELDKIVEKRLAKEKRKFEKYKDVDVDEYNKWKKEKADQEEAAKTELDKANEKAEEAEKKSKQAIETANKRLILAEFKVLAKDANIKYINDAYQLADLSEVEVKDDGSIEGLKEVIEDLVKEKPFLVDTDDGAMGGTGKIGDKAKGEKGKTKFSFGKELALEKKKLAGDVSKSNYFK